MGDSTDYNRWINRARQDIRTAKNNLDDDPKFLAEAISYSAQQAAEKLLKAYLLFKGSTLMRTHDLVFLLEKCIEFEPKLVKLREAVMSLNEYSVEARYPGDFIDEISVSEAKEAFAQARLIEMEILTLTGLY